MSTFKINKRIELEVSPEETGFVPVSHSFLAQKEEKKLLEGIALAVNNKMPILLIGETGSGKTSLIRYLASMTNNGFRRVNHNGGTSVEDVVGKILVNKEGTYWIDGVLLDAMRKGHWYLADELNASSAEINFVYHSLLDDDGYIVVTENQGEIVKPHKNFRFFAAMNPSHDYSGSKELNKALMSRFTVFKVDFPSPGTETKILTERTGIPEEVAQNMVKFAADVRGTHTKGSISYVLSTRDLLMWAQVYNYYKKYIPSAEMTILNKVGIDDFETIKDSLAVHFKTLDEGKKKVEEVVKDDTQIKIGDIIEVFGNNCGNYLSSRAVVIAINVDKTIRYKGDGRTTINFCDPKDARKIEVDSFTDITK